MKTEITTQQAITLYTVIEALKEQFDRDNLAAERRKDLTKAEDGVKVHAPVDDRPGRTNQ